jgi:hypothetical protein
MLPIWWHHVAHLMASRSPYKIITLPNWIPHVAKLQPSCSQSLAIMLPSCCNHVVHMKPTCCQAVAIMSQWWAKMLLLPSCFPGYCNCRHAIKLLQSVVKLLQSGCYAAAITKLLQLCYYAAAIRKLLPLCWEAAAVILAVIGEEEFVKVLSRVVTVRWREDFFIPETAVGGGSNCFSISTIFTAT